jgi:hypothetical protein
MIIIVVPRTIKASALTDSLLSVKKRMISIKVIRKNPNLLLLVKKRMISIKVIRKNPNP